MGRDAVLATLRDVVIPNGLRTGHPGFLGWVTTGPSVIPAVAGLVASVAAPQRWWVHPANHLDSLAVEWVRDLLGFPGTFVGTYQGGHRGPWTKTDFAGSFRLVGAAPFASSATISVVPLSVAAVVVAVVVGSNRVGEEIRRRVETRLQAMLPALDRIAATRHVPPRVRCAPPSAGQRARIHPAAVRGEIRLGRSPRRGGRACHSRWRQRYAPEALRLRVATEAPRAA